MDEANDQKKKIRLIAFYLPQYYPMPENDSWWGVGFTEWTNSSKARPMFKRHYQPHIPADLGYYDLRLPDARIAQAAMARSCGIEGFCYWHYWFGNGKRLLELPFAAVLKSGKPDFPFILAWANQTWTGVWHGCPDRVLIEQKYPGVADYEAHFYSLLEAFSDKRYIKIDNRPVFVVYKVDDLPNPKMFAECWNKLAIRAGFKGMYLIGNKELSWTPNEYGFDANINNDFVHAYRQIKRKFHHRIIKRLEVLTGIDVHYLYRRTFNKPTIHSYEETIKYMNRPLRKDVVQFPCVYPNWDNTPRSGYRGIVLEGSTPELFKRHLRDAITKICDREHDKRFVFIKSWNEWAEGNHLEPDLKYGRAYLDVIKNELTKIY